MNDASLLILAAGLGSRYNGQKQIDSVSNERETLMEFALYDALKVGIRKFVFIVNSKFPNDYKNHLEQIIRKENAEIYFVEQTVEKYIPTDFLPKLAHRKKPIGTAHAVFCAKEIINETFITMNADDFYGFQSFQTAMEFVSETKNLENQFGLVAFELKNTLSENGGVSRGICTQKDRILTKIEEFVQIQRKENEIIGINENLVRENLKENDLVSMNFWVLKPKFFELAEKELNQFLQENEDLSNVEFYLPTLIDKAIQQNEVEVLVLLTNEKWFGLTYPEDKIKVEKEIESRKAKKIYPEKLWN